MAVSASTPDLASSSRAVYRFFDKIEVTYILHFETAGIIFFSRKGEREIFGGLGMADLRT